MQKAPIPPTHLNPNLTPQVEHVILKSLEKRRLNRYPDVLTFIQALQAIPVSQTHTSIRRQTTAPMSLNKTREQYLNSGMQFYSLKRYREALAAFEQALRLDHHYVDALLGKGNTLYFLGQYEDALLAYEQAIDLDPHNATLHNNKGSALYALRRYREALSSYKQTLRINPLHASALQGKKRALIHLRRLL